MKAMLTFLITVIGIYLAILALMYVFQRNLMYQPGTTMPAPSDTLIPSAKIETLTSEGGHELVSWFLPPKPGMPVIIYFQGNAGTIANRDYKVAPWHQLGYGVWMTGYRGYGGNPGAPSESGLYADARAAISVLNERGIGPDNIIIYGESLGTGVATQMAVELAASQSPVRGLVLEAPFTAMGDAAQDHYPFLPARWLVKDEYDSLSKIAQIKTPLLIVHGDKDKVVKQDHGRRLFAAASRPKTALWIKGAAHNDLYEFGAGNQIAKFFESLR